MIEAKDISILAELDEEVLNGINKDIIDTASKGNYSVFTYALQKLYPNIDSYTKYLESLGYSIRFSREINGLIHLSWSR